MIVNPLTRQVINANPKGCNQYSGEDCSFYPDPDEPESRPMSMVPFDSLAAEHDEGYSPTESDEHVDHLLKSISKSKKIQALSVSKDKDKYRVIDGKHRYRVIKKLGIKSVGVHGS